jgi:drug/metabolite transporter (DMT)-like permease
MPILILPFSIFLYRERISLRAVVGAVVAIAGVALLSVPC